MSIKMRFVAIILIFAMVLTACSSNNTNTSTGNQTSSSSSSNKSESSGGDTGEKVELKFWDMAWGQEPYVEKAKELVARFNEEHPNIEVVYQPTPWNNWAQNFSTAVASNSAPDISTGGAFQAFYFYDQDAILPVDDVVEEMKQDGFIDDFIDGALDALYYDGHYVSLPWLIDVRVPFYRKDIFEQYQIDMPKTWAELESSMEKLVADGKYGLAVSSKEVNGAQILFSLILNNGGGLFNEDQTLNILDERNIEALEFFARLTEKGIISKAAAGYAQEDAKKQFAQGDAAVYYGAPAFLKEFPEISDQFGVMEPMEGPHGDLGTVRWVNNIMIYKQTQHPEEAKTFLSWWVRNNDELFTVGEVGLPARKSIMQDPFFTNNERLNQILEQWVPVGKNLSYKSPGAFPSLHVVDGDATMAILQQMIISGEDVRSAAEMAQQELSDVVN